MKDQMLKIIVILVMFSCGAQSRSQMTSQIENKSSADSLPIQKESEKPPETVVREKYREEEEYHVRIPPPFVEEFAGIPRPSRRWTDKKRETREVNTRVSLPTPSCGEHVKPCSCCCKFCWEFSFQNLKLCFKSCSSAHENCSCQKSQFYPLDFKKGGFSEMKA